MQKIANRRDAALPAHVPLCGAAWVCVAIGSGAFLSVGSALSAATKNQVIAFVLAVSLCFVFALAASPVVSDFLRQSAPGVADVLRRVGVLERYQDFTRGVISLPDIVYFASFIGFWLFVTAIIVDLRKAD